MGRYIDTSEFYANYEREKKAGRSGDEAVSNAMVATKAADVRKVVRGEWTAARRGEWSNYEYTCSVCGCDKYRHKTYNGEVRLMNFCPNCGADMRQADDE